MSLSFWLITFADRIQSLKPDMIIMSKVNFGQLLHLVFTEPSDCSQELTKFFGILLPYWLLLFYGLNLIAEFVMQRNFTRQSLIN